MGFCLDVYSNFAGVGDSFVPFPDQTRYRLPLADAGRRSTRAMLRQIFLAPQELDASRRAARVTRELAGRLAKLSEQLEQAGHAPDVVAQFLMRCLFTMFSGGRPDSEKPPLPAAEPVRHPRAAGRSCPTPSQPLAHHGHGRLLARPQGPAAPLQRQALSRCLGPAPERGPGRAAAARPPRADWTEVEPAIFGTLLERALAAMPTSGKWTCM